MHKTPSATWRARIASHRDSVKEEIENAFGQKSKRIGTRAAEMKMKMSRKREKVISEIFSTEKTYQEQLQVVIKVGFGEKCLLYETYD